jgi:hypothetical protein
MYYALGGAIPCALHKRWFNVHAYPVTVRLDPAWAALVATLDKPDALPPKEMRERHESAIGMWHIDLEWVMRRLCLLETISRSWRDMIQSAWRDLQHAFLIVARSRIIKDLPALHISKGSWKRGVEYMYLEQHQPLVEPYKARLIGTMRQLYTEFKRGYVGSLTATEFTLPASEADERRAMTMDTNIYYLTHWPRVGTGSRPEAFTEMWNRVHHHQEQNAIRTSLWESLQGGAHIEINNAPKPTILDDPPVAAPPAPTLPPPRTCPWCRNACIVRVSKTEANPDRKFWVCPNACQDGRWIGWADNYVVTQIAAKPCACCRAVLDIKGESAKHDERYEFDYPAATATVTAAIIAGTYVCEQCLGR